MLAKARAWDEQDHLSELHLRKTVIVALDGFVYSKTKRFVRRIPTEIYTARGKLSRPIGYHDAGPLLHKFNMTRRYSESRNFIS